MTVPPLSRDVDELLAAYQTHSRKINERQQIYLARGIKRLEIIPDPKHPDHFHISADLHNANLATVMNRLIEATAFEFSLGGSRMSERITARFEGRALPKALSLLLGPAGYRAIIDGGVIRIERAALAYREELSEGKLLIEVPLKYVDTDFSEPFLEKLYPKDRYEGMLTFAMNPSRNTVVLSGEANAVRNAARILGQVDKDGDHVLIEVLVVEFSTGAFREISSRIFNAAKGKISDINIDFSALAGKTISFTHVADALNVSQLSAVLNLLIEDNAAQVIARPYLATLSNAEASIEITSDRYVTVQGSSGLDARLEKVASGVEMEINPTIQMDGLIHLHISVTQSKFSGGEGASLNTSTNTVETVTRVGDGETVIIGGLMLNVDSTIDSGLPTLRDIPVAGALFGQKHRTQVQRQVMIYVTPHLWNPGTETPLLKRDNLFMPWRGRSVKPSSPRAIYNKYKLRMSRHL